MEKAHGSTRHADRSISFRVTESRVSTGHQAPAKTAATARHREFGRRSSQESPKLEGGMTTEGLIFQ